METALHRAVSTIQGQLDAKRYVVGTLMDIEGAFNHTSREVIIRMLNRHQTSVSIIEWIDHLSDP